VSALQTVDDPKQRLDDLGVGPTEMMSTPRPSFFRRAIALALSAILLAALGCSKGARHAEPGDPASPSTRDASPARDALAAAPAAPKGPPANLNILFITVDSLRRHVVCRLRASHRAESDRIREA